MNVLGTWTTPRLAAAIAAVALVVLPAAAETPAKPAQTITEKGKIEQIIRDYLRDNPQVIIEAIETWRAQQRKAQENKAKLALTVERPQIYESPGSPVAGNLKGDVTVVEFFDYQCGYCKRVMPGFIKTVEQDGNVRVVFKEFPILGPASRAAAEAALASRGQGKYFEYHRALMALKTAVNEKSIMAVAKSVGLDVARLKKDMQSSAVQDEINKNLELATRLGIRGTPAFIIGERLVPGAIDVNTMKSLIARARDKS